jgi:hypothetical protein
MILPPQLTERFYRIWWALLRYANTRCHILPEPVALPPEGTLAPTDGLKLREVVWGDDALREVFIAENPAGLPPEDLGVVRSWQHRVTGTFFVLRHLKKYSVFLAEASQARAYGVVGLVSPFEEVIGPYLPRAVQAVLVPFEDRITYDGLLNGYSVSFGAGIRRSLDVAYRNAREREGIITSLPATEQTGKDIAARNASVLAAFRTALYRSGLGTKAVERHVRNIETFTNGYLSCQEQPRGLAEIGSEDLEDFLDGDVQGPDSLLISFQRFVRFLYESERIGPDVDAAFRDVFRSRRRTSSSPDR